MELKKYLLYPIGIYAVIFLFISALIGAKLDQRANWVSVVSLVITIVGFYLATGYAQPKKWQEGLRYGLAWLAVLVILDWILTVPFTGTAYYSDWKTYVVYAVAVFTPVLFAGKIKK